MNSMESWYKCPVRVYGLSPHPLPFTTGLVSDLRLTLLWQEIHFAFISSLVADTVSSTGLKSACEIPKTWVLIPALPPAPSTGIKLCASRAQFPHLWNEENEPVCPVRPSKPCGTTTDFSHTFRLADALNSECFPHYYILKYACSWNSTGRWNPVAIPSKREIAGSLARTGGRSNLLCFFVSFSHGIPWTPAQHRHQGRSEGAKTPKSCGELHLEHHHLKGT